jgi:hypothetical protein
MRTDENGHPCPATLGEYRDLCVALSPLGDECAAVKLLDGRIAKDGRDELVIVHDCQMRALLFPMMLAAE